MKQLNIVLAIIDKSMKISKIRTLLGFLIAPGTPALANYLISLQIVSYQEARMKSIILCVFGYMAATIVGIPIYIYFNVKRIVSLKAYAFAGAFIGFSSYILVFVVWGLLSYRLYPEHIALILRNSIMSGVTAVVYAMLASIIFWICAVCLGHKR